MYSSRGRTCVPAGSASGLDRQGRRRRRGIALGRSWGPDDNRMADAGSPGPRPLECLDSHVRCRCHTSYTVTGLTESAYKIPPSSRRTIAARNAVGCNGLAKTRSKRSQALHQGDASGRCRRAGFPVASSEGRPREPMERPRLGCERLLRYERFAACAVKDSMRPLLPECPRIASAITDDHGAEAQALSDYIKGLRQILAREMAELGIEESPEQAAADTALRNAVEQADEVVRHCGYRAGCAWRSREHFEPDPNRTRHPRRAMTTARMRSISAGASLRTPKRHSLTVSFRQGWMLCRPNCPAKKLPSRIWSYIARTRQSRSWGSVSIVLTRLSRTGGTSAAISRRRSPDSGRTSRRSKQGNRF